MVRKSKENTANHKNKSKTYHQKCGYKRKRKMESGISTLFPRVASD